METQKESWVKAAQGIVDAKVSAAKHSNSISPQKVYVLVNKEGDCYIATNPMPDYETHHVFKNGGELALSSDEITDKFVQPKTKRMAKKAKKVAKKAPGKKAAKKAPSKVAKKAVVKGMSISEKEQSGLLKRVMISFNEETHKGLYKKVDEAAEKKGMSASKYILDVLAKEVDQ